jgi:hypothetical protein
MGNRIGRWAVAAAAAMALAAAAQADTITPQIVNGNPTQQQAVTGALLQQFGFGLGSTCTGTLVGCRTFVTAAHCVCPGDSFCQVNPTPLRVFLQHAGIFAVDRVDVHPSFAFGLRNDVAVLTLGKPVEGISPVVINLAGTPPHGTAGTIVGFGVSRGTADDGGLKRAGQVTLASCAAAPFPVPEPAHLCWSFTGPLGPAGEDSNTCSGDSGGPLFVDLGAGPVLAGVTSGGSSDDCLPEDVSFDANVYENRSFLQGAAGSDLGATCGTLPPVGSAATTVTAAGSATLTDAARACRKEVAKQVVKLIRAEFKALRGCLDGVAAGRVSGPCPDTRAALAIDKARANVDAGRIARKCPAGVVGSSLLGGACAAASDAEGLRDCILGRGSAAAEAMILTAYGAADAAVPSDEAAVNCRKAAGAGLAKYVATRLKASAACRASADKGLAGVCPDERAAAKIAGAFDKLVTAVGRRCTDSLVAGLGSGGGFGPVCAGVTSVATLNACLRASADAESDAADALVVAVQTGADVRIDVPAGASMLRVTLNAVDPAQGAPNDLDLFVRRGAAASPAQFDARSIDGGVFEAVEIATPGAGTWFAHVQEVAGSRVPFQLTATVFAE